MPYLYAQAVRAHEEGRPMLRPMILDFPQDRSCETLDKQYMLGDSLLVAPIFKESGEVEYYLPKGKWVQLFTGEVINGGEWKKETHDYFSLPLLVKPNSILAVGACHEKPDYDFAENVTFYLSEFEDGAESVIFVTDVKGNKVRRVKATRNGSVIKVTVEGGSENWDCEMLAGKVKKVRMVNVMELQIL